jgi:hypothetical protein
MDSFSKMAPSWERCFPLPYTFQALGCFKLEAGLINIHFKRHRHADERKNVYICESQHAQTTPVQVYEVLPRECFCMVCAHRLNLFATRCTRKINNLSYLNFSALKNTKNQFLS